MFKRFMPLSEAYGNDHQVINLKIIGGVEIAIGFFILGIFSVLLAGVVSSKIRRRQSYLVGTFLIFCSFARMMEVIAIWIAYQRFIAYLMIITGTLALIACAFLPKYFRSVFIMKTVHDATEQMKENVQKIDKLNEIGEKVLTTNERHSNGQAHPT
jgi:hypothetical protein